MSNKAETRVKDLLLNVVEIALTDGFLHELCYCFHVAIQAISSRGMTTDHFLLMTISNAFFI